MALSKAQRAALREKFGGRCAYCGQPLGDKWHADHIEPIVRNDWYQRAGFSIPPRGPDYPHRDTLENMNLERAYRGCPDPVPEPGALAPWDEVTPNAKSEPTAPLLAQVGSTDGLCGAVSPAPTF